jgi:hypothetical protein
LSVADAAGRYRFHPGTKLREATHGICPSCCAREMAALEKRDFDFVELAAAS